MPPGTALRTVPGQVSRGPGWYFDPRGWVEVDGNGAVLGDLYIPYNINISGSNVTIEDVKLVHNGQSSFGISLRHTANVTIENSTISGTNTGAGRLMVGIKDVFGDSTGLQVLDNNISMVSTGVQLESGLVRGNYIHNLGYIAGDHVDGISSDGGTTRLLTIEHNTVFTDRAQTCAVCLFEDFGVQANRVITDNLVAGGSYAIYGGQSQGRWPTSNITVTDNQISDIYYPRGGKYGPVTAFNPAGRGNVWSGNVWAGAGLPVRMGFRHAPRARRQGRG